MISKLDMTPRARILIGLLGGAAWLASAAPAAAQADTPATPAAQEDESEIIVTGFRASLNAALTDKREANAIVDVIRAEDIADFPDNNLAESIQRIPGVAITRDQGEGRQITVRGLGPLSTRVRINGMEGLSTTGGADASGGANRGRQFDFNIFASELFNAITVRKTATGDVEEGSLGATVDLQTARPFDFRQNLVVAGSVQGAYNDLSDAFDPRVAGLVSARFADGRAGILLSAAYATRDILEEGPSTVRWERGTDNGGFAPGSALPTGATQGFAFFHPRIPRYDSYRYDTERLGLTGSFQVQPQDSTLITFDVLYARFESNRAEQYLEAISFSRNAAAGGKPQTVILPGAVVDGSNSLVYGVFDNVDVRVESRFDELITTFHQYSGSVRQELGDRLTANLFAGWSRSKFRNPIQTTVTLDALNIQGYSYDYRDGRFPIFGYGSLDVANPNNFTLSEVRLRPQFVDNRFRVLRGDLNYEASQQVTLRGGVDHKRYGFDSRELRRASETQVPVLAPGQLASLTDLYSIVTPLPGGTPSTFVVPNLEAFINTIGIYSNTGMFTLQGIENATARGNFRTVTEEHLGIWGQVDYAFDLGGVRLRGNLGLRWVETDQNSTGYTGAGPTLSLVSITRSYDNWLPSFNIAAELGRGFILRGAIARTLARPDIGTLNPGGNFSISGGNRTFARGNPFINPTQATIYDLAAEWYFAPESAFTVGLFYKNISTFVATTVQQIPFNQLGLPDVLLQGTTVQPTDIFTVTQPVNSDGGSLKGIEVGIQAPFRFLPGVLRNFGIQANYTFVDSEIEYPLTTAANAPVVIQPLVNLSRHSANLTLYYEDRRFRIRGSLAYRSGYLQQVPGRNGVAPPSPNAAQPTFNDVEGVHSSLNVDMSASFAITDNISLTFEGVNLTDEYVDQYIDSQADRLSTYHHTGRQFYFGVRVRY